MKQEIELDKPLTSILDDTLGVSDLAIKVARRLSLLSSNEGFVVGLHGAWGSGKTTFINFVKESFSNLQINKPEIMDFNPWLFSGHEDLVQKFLYELSIVLAPTEFEGVERRKWFFSSLKTVSEISTQIIMYAAALKGMAAPVIIGALNPVSKLINNVLGKLNKVVPLSEQRKKIEDSLRARDRKILVIIDDMDRLEPQEIIDIFRMVKSVANFPNIIYLLVFDKKYVHDAVEKIRNCNGSEYVEKIIQYDIDLPIADSASIMSIFSKKVDSTIDLPSGKMWDKDRWSLIYHGFLKSKMETPRQALKLANSFNVTYPALIGEVDPVDFMALESIRVFYPVIYNEIQRNRFKFLNGLEFSVNDRGKDAKDINREYYETVINNAKDEDKEGIKDVLINLFSKVSEAFKEYSSPRDSELSTLARLSSEAHFATYFSYSLQSNRFSEAELKEVIKSAEKSEDFTRILLDTAKQVNHTNKSRLPDLLSRLLDNIKEGQADVVLPQIIKSLLISGDQIIIKSDEENNGLINIGNEERMMWVIFQAMKRLPQPELYPILQESLENTESLYLTSRLLYQVGKEHGKYGNKTVETLFDNGVRITDEQQFQKLELALVERMRAAANNGTLSQMSNLKIILYRWVDFSGSRDEPYNWLQSIISNDDSKFIDVINMLKSVSTISSGIRTREEVYFDLNKIPELIDVKTASERVQTILDQNDPNDSKFDVLKIFRTAVENNQDVPAPQPDQS